jgi:hypothetical protein
MTINFKEIIEQCDVIDAMDEETTFSISGTQLQALAQLKKIENMLTLLNSSIYHIDDNSSEFAQENTSYTIYTDLPSMKFDLLAPSHEDTSMQSTNLIESKKLANETVKALSDDPLAHLTEHNANLDTFQGKKIISYHYKEKQIAILCEEDGEFTVGVSDDEGTEAAPGFSEKLAIIFDIFYQEIASESDSSNSDIYEEACH